MPCQSQFVAVSDPTGPVSSESRKLRHSHAIRQKHAKERRLRMQNYQRNLMRVRAGEPSALVAAENSTSFSRMLDYSKDPFSAMAESLSSHEYFLLHHCTSIEARNADQDLYRPLAQLFNVPSSHRDYSTNMLADIHVLVPQHIAHCGLFNYPGDHEEQVLGDWVGLAINNKDLLDSAVLLGACRSMLRSKPDDHNLARLALQYKQRGLESLWRALSGTTPIINVLTVAMYLPLVFDEEAFGDMGIVRQHLRVISAMAELSGDPGALGSTGLLERVYNRFVEWRELGDMDLRNLCGSKVAVAFFD